MGHLVGHKLEGCDQSRNDAAENVERFGFRPCPCV